MSKILYNLLIIIILSPFSCKRNNLSQETKKDNFKITDTTGIETENSYITRYKTFISQLDSADSNFILKATEQYKALFINQSATLCDTAFTIFKNKYDTICIKLNMQMLADTISLKPLYDKSLKISKNLKDYLLILHNNGFKISKMDSTFYIEQDWNFLIDNYFESISQPMRDYLSEIHTETKEGFAKNGTISINYKKLIDRILWYESFLAINEHFICSDDCRKIQKAYLTYLMTGYEKSVIYQNGSSGSVSPYFQDAYHYLFSKYPKSTMTRLVKPYYEALQKHEDATVKDILKDFHIKGLIYSPN